MFPKDLKNMLWGVYFDKFAFEIPHTIFLNNEVIAKGILCNAPTIIIIK